MKINFSIDTLEQIAFFALVFDFVASVDSLISIYRGRPIYEYNLYMIFISTILCFICLWRRSVLRGQKWKKSYEDAYKQIIAYETTNLQENEESEEDEEENTVDRAPDSDGDVQNIQETNYYAPRDYFTHFYSTTIMNPNTTRINARVELSEEAKQSLFGILDKRYVTREEAHYKFQRKNRLAELVSGKSQIKEDKQ